MHVLAHSHGITVRNAPHQVSAAMIVSPRNFIRMVTGTIGTTLTPRQPDPNP